MSSLGLTVLPKDDSLQRAIMGVVEGWQRRKSENAALAQQESQFGRTHALDEQRTKSLVDTNRAASDNANLQTLSQRAGAITKGLFATADDLAKKGAKPEEIQTFIVSSMKNFEDDPAKPQALRDLFAEVRMQLVPVFTQQPDTPKGQMERNAFEFGADSAARAEAGGTSPIDISLARRVATGESLPAQEFADVQQREAGPGQHSQYVKIAGDITPGATPQLSAETQRRISAANNATQLQIAREGDATQRAIAAATLDAKAKSDGGATTAAQRELKQEAVRLIDELLTHPGRESASGLSGSITRNIPATDARGFASKVERLKAIMTLDNLKLLKGAMSDKDLAFLMSLPGALDLGMADNEVKSELLRARTTLVGDKLVTRDELRRMGSSEEEARANGYEVTD